MPSMPVPFVGPSYQLANRRADVQRAINMYPVLVESGSGKSPAFLKAVHGYEEYYNSTTAGLLRAMHVRDGGSVVYVMFQTGGMGYLDAGVYTSLSGVGSNFASTITSGRSHVVFTTGAAVYAYDVSTTAFAQVTDADLFPFCRWAEYLGGRYIYGGLNIDQFQWSDIDDPFTIDALDFATAESSVDGILRGIVYREELWLFGSRSTEVWRLSASADAAFEKNTGVSINVGTNAPYAICVADNSLFWIGADRNGVNVVYSATGYQPQRISNHSIEEMLAQSTDIASTSAYTYQWKGHVFLCINTPGVDSTLVYDVTTRAWHERTDFYNGDHEQCHITHHAVLADGTHIFGGSLTNHPTTSDRAIFYTASDDVYTINGDTLCRERISPHYATPQYNTIFYPRFRLDCSVGGVVASPKYVQLSYSNDGGATWSASALQRSLGETGDRRVMVQWNRLGSARDRVWRVRCTEDCAFDIVGADIQAIPGVS